MICVDRMLMCIVSSHWTMCCDATKWVFTFVRQVRWIFHVFCHTDHCLLLVRASWLTDRRSLKMSSDVLNSEQFTVQCDVFSEIRSAAVCSASAQMFAITAFATFFSRLPCGQTWEVQLIDRSYVCLVCIVSSVLPCIHCHVFVLTLPTDSERTTV